MTTFVKSQELKDVRRVCSRGMLLLFPFLILQLLELFVLPLDFFTFRVWEAALGTPFLYPGPFYPNIHIKKTREYGDCYRSGDPSKVQAKPVEWFTDASGWRNRPEIEKKDHYDMVVVGDSNIVGSFLDQKDTISEILGNRSGKVGYSYSLAHDKPGLFFSDPKIVQKKPSLLVVESKVGNWNENNSYLINFREWPDGSLDLVNREQEFTTYYAPTRQPFLEKIVSQFAKHAMFYSLKSNLFTEFLIPPKNSSEIFIGNLSSSPSDQESGWRPDNWVVESGVFKPLPSEAQPALAIRATGPNAYWHTERFVSSRRDGKIIVRFDAKNSVVPSRHRVYVFEDGSYRSVGEFVPGSGWRTFEISIDANLGSILEFQIDQRDDWQWLSIRDFHVVYGSPIPLVRQVPVMIPMSGWTGGGTSCGPPGGNTRNCGQWSVAGKKGYIQSPVLPRPGAAGVLVIFEARTDKPVDAFSAVYLFEGDKYRAVAQYAFSTDWRKFRFLIQPDTSVPSKIQVDYPDSVEWLSIRNFQAIPVDRVLKNGGNDGSSQQKIEKIRTDTAERRSEKSMSMFPIQINSAPLFESQQSWSSGFLKAKGHGAGVVVGPGTGNPNVFAQAFSAAPGESFKIIARASSVGNPESMARFQVNWVDPSGKFISASIKSFEVVSAEKVFEHVVVAPAGTTSGTLYVVADGPEDVVRYSEMRLMGSGKKINASKTLSSREVSPGTKDATPSFFPKPSNLTPLDGSGKTLTVAESQYYFYHAARAMQRRARERGMDLILYVMPDFNISRLLPSIKQLRLEGIKVLAYEPQGSWTSGVDTDWYWQKADSHWTEAAVRLTADEILTMWKMHKVSSRPFSKALMSDYANGFPKASPWEE